MSPQGIRKTLWKNPCWAVCLSPPRVQINVQRSSTFSAVGGRGPLRCCLWRREFVSDSNSKWRNSPANSGQLLNASMNGLLVSLVFKLRFELSHTTSHSHYLQTIYVTMFGTKCTLDGNQVWPPIVEKCPYLFSWNNWLLWTPMFPMVHWMDYEFLQVLSQFLHDSSFLFIFDHLHYDNSRVAIGHSGVNIHLADLPRWVLIMCDTYLCDNI